VNEVKARDAIVELARSMFERRLTFGSSGNISIKLENVPAPDNPKTAWLACYSALAALRQLTSRTHCWT